MLKKMQNNSKDFIYKEGKIMIALFTANQKGGIVQFTLQLNNTLKELGYKTVIYVPSDINITSNGNEFNIIKYNKNGKFYLKRKNLNRLKKNIIENQVELIIFTDSSIISQQMLQKLNNTVKNVLCVHDVVAHPSNEIKEIIKGKAINWYLKYNLKIVVKIVLLSENSEDIFKKKYPKFSNKVLLFRLGAHVPDEVPKKPKEILGTQKYILFFGRISKYKGVFNLIDAYVSIKKEISDINLVIAGEGKLSNDEREKINANGIMLINRFILDEEMVWLFENARSLVLPYIEASQSGIIPISYYYNKPVIVTNLPGLSENVADKKSGFIVKDKNDLCYAIKKIWLMDEKKYRKMQENISLFYKNNYDWKKNINEVLKEIHNE